MASNPITVINNNIKNNINKSSLAKTDDELRTDITDNTTIIDTGRFVGQDEVMKRFHLGNEFGSSMHSQVFTDGFEDPTRLMFKVEFGEWGSTLLDINTVTLHLSSSKFSNVYYEDYDLFPMGLLDLNFNDGDLNKPGNWNSLTSYNTYNYLRNNNEDARASYIKLFVLGLYDIQKNMPYLFKNITGIEKLQEFSPDKGMRLKDAKITLNCYEGVDLKIRTLLLLYRKAAYDDVWLRWVLPDIYRYFKMIIYVFDRRILHTGKGTYSVDQEDFPIYALECGPCEIDIEPLFENDFSTAYSDHKDAETKITITVKNVKTYYANKLFNKIDSLNVKVNWISDFDSVSERGDFAAPDMSNKLNFRMYWLQRMFMTPSEYNAYYNNVTHKVGDDNDYKMRYEASIMPDDTWHYATVRDDFYMVHSWKDLWKQLKKAMTTKTSLVRDSRFSSNRFSFYNDLQRLEENSYYYNYYHHLTGINIYKADMLMREHIQTMIHHMLHSTYYKDNEVYYSLIDPGVIDTSIPDTSPNVRPNMNVSLPDMEYIKPNLDTSLPDMEYVRPNLDASLPDMEYVRPNLDASLPDMEYVRPNLDTSLPDMEYVRPNLDASLPDMIYTEPIMNLDKPWHNMVTPILDLTKNEHPYTLLIMSDIDTSLLYITLLDGSLNMNHPMISVDLTVYDSSQVLVRPNLDTITLTHNWVYPILDTSIPDMNLIEPILDTYKNSHPYVELNTSTDLPDMTMISNITNTSLDISINPVYLQDTPKNSSIPFIRVNTSVLLDTSLQYITVNSYNEHNEIPMVPLSQDILHIQSHNLITVPQDIRNTSMVLVSNVVDTSVVLNPMIAPVILDNYVPQTLLPLKGDIDHEIHSQMVEPEKSLYNASLSLTMIDNNTSKILMDLIPLNTNVSVIDSMDMTTLDTCVYNVKQDMVTLQNTSVLSEMDMTYINLDTSLSDMIMTSLDSSVILPLMDFTHVNLNVSISDMLLIGLNNNTSLPDMEYTHIIDNVSLPDMEYTHIIDNVSLPILKMENVYPATDTSIIMDMTRTNEPNEIQQIPLVHNIPENISIPVTPFTRPILNVSTPNITMVSNTSYIKPEISTDSLIDNIVKADKNTKYSMTMVNITEDTNLVNKILALTSINTDEIKTVDTDKLLSLASLIEQTYDEIRKRSKDMKLQDNKPNIPKHEHMIMQAIKQPPRNTFIVDKLHDVDLNAIDRAYNARSAANSEKTKGTRGTAI